MDTILYLASNTRGTLPPRQHAACSQVTPLLLITEWDNKLGRSLEEWGNGDHHHMVETLLQHSIRPPSFPLSGSLRMRLWLWLVITQWKLGT